MAYEYLPGIMSDVDIMKASQEEGLVSPFCVSVNKDSEGRRICSYGVSSYGYDMRLGGDFLVAREQKSDMTAVLDVHDAWLTKEAFVTRKVAEGCALVIPPHGFALATTLETVKMPEDCIAICLGKSTYARVGLVVNVTPLEPGWEGQITMELSNTTNLPLKVYVGEGIMQVLFFKGARPCRKPYTSRSGKYTGQTGPTLPRV